jgi:hypothetical protein
MKINIILNIKKYIFSKLINDSIKKCLNIDKYLIKILGI